VIGFFGLLTLGFLFRFLQNGYHWLGGHSTADVNYKALTVWCLVYVVVCSGIAAFAYWLPAEDDTAEG
jgi:H+/Cl- antiporter ClcA